MSREKYLANIDRVLLDVINKTSGDIGKTNKIAYSEELEANGTIKKVAFDVFRMENDPYDGLWIVEDVDGSPHLVRASDPQYDQTHDGSWTVTSNYDKNNVTLSYNKFPIAGFSSDKYGFSSDDIITFKSALLKSVNTDETFVQDVLKEQPESKRLALLEAYPEFKKFIQG
jgi:hypothetical protein